MPVNNPARTLAQIAAEEQAERVQAINDAGLPLTNAQSNRARVNNTDAASMDSQGLADSHANRDEPNESFNMNTFQAYESYATDPLGEVEARKASGAGGATEYADRRTYPTNAPSDEPDR